MVRSFTQNIPTAQLPPHYFLGRATKKGIKGKFFLEEGLSVAVSAARARLAELLNAAIRRIPEKNFNLAKTGAFSTGAGIKFGVIQNVSELSKINVKKLIRQSFAETVPLAKQVSDQAFLSSVEGGSRPLTKAGIRAPVVSSYKYEVFNTTDGIILRPAGKGNAKNVAKVRALNFGLRSSDEDFQQEDSDED